MTWGLVAVAGATIVGGVMSSNAQSDAADSQAQSAANQTALQKQMFEKQLELLDPFRQAGLDKLAALGGIAGNPIDRDAELAAYYKSPEFAQMSGEARNQQLAASEAMGGLGSTSTSNSLAAIAPTLGQNYLGYKAAEQQDMYNQLLGMANIGLSGAGSQSSAAGSFGSNAANIMAQNSAQQTQMQLANAQMWNNTMGQLGGIAYHGFSRDGGWGF